MTDLTKMSSREDENVEYTNQHEDMFQHHQHPPSPVTQQSQIIEVQPEISRPKKRINVWGRARGHLVVVIKVIVIGVGYLDNMKLLHMFFLLLF